MTYICRAKIPSHTYAKHQCRQKSEYESKMIIYIPTILYKYIVITECDPILQEYYITKEYKSMIYKVIYKVQNADRISRAGQEGLEEGAMDGL